MAKTEDDKVQKIANMLEIGATMLAQHCNACGAPMFRYQGQVLCPICKDVSDPRDNYQQTAATAPRSNVGNNTISPKKIPPKSIKVEGAAEEFLSKMDGSRSVPDSASSLSPELESLLMAKMVSIAHSMQEEGDARILTDYMDLIERGLSIIEKLRKTV
jgi:UPF0148 protein